MTREQIEIALMLLGEGLPSSEVALELTAGKSETVFGYALGYCDALAAQYNIKPKLLRIVK